MSETDPSLPLESERNALYGVRDILDRAWGRDDVVRLEVGEPNFDPPVHVVDAACTAALNGQAKYTPNAGLPELREALAEKVRRVNRYAARTEQIIVTHGAVEGLFSLVAGLLSPGDELLLPDPGWPNFRMICSVLGVQAVGYPLDVADGYTVDIEEIERRITSRTKAILINSPSNPLGSVIAAEKLVALVELAERHDLWLISDECYDEIVFDDAFRSTAAVASSPKLISVYSFSKSHAMTGWRVGYLVVPDELQTKLTRIQEPIISCVSAPAQYAALAALTGPQDHIAEMVTSYRRNRDLAATLLDEARIPHVLPAGAFYMWLNIPDSADGMTVARELVTRHGVAVAPGPTFGPSGRHALRLSLATTSDLLTAGITRLLESGLITQL